jgi:hypothetical protein
MDNDSVESLLNSVIDELAEVEHERWSHWQRYMHDQGTRMPDGSLVLPAGLVERWDQQIKTEFPNLTEEEKESDREQVRRYFRTITTALSRMR